jgi:ABC-type multidrug transport system ATPase subunit
MVSLRFEQVAKSYGGTPVLRELSITFEAGRVAALVGPNGAGKTTMLRIGAGLQFADAGRVDATDVLYYGGFDTLPLRGTIDGLRRALGLGPAPDGRRSLSRLSRGQLHQTGLDIALESNCSTLLLDEPWTSLEPDAREALNERLSAAAAAGRLVLCSSHDLDEVARVADEVAFLRDGVITRVRREELDDPRFDRGMLLQRYRGTGR